jgi:hypothetical protein
MKKILENRSRGLFLFVKKITRRIYFYIRVKIGLNKVGALNIGNSSLPVDGIESNLNKIIVSLDQRNSSRW